MITIEIAKTDRVSCRTCHKRIIKGTNKGVIQEKGFNGYEVKKSFCMNCIEKIVLEKITELEELLKKIGERKCGQKEVGTL
jgi:DNA-directed RNA polymerase subunit RPC12/RpoP